MASNREYKIFIRKEVDLDNLRNLRELSPWERIIAAIKFRYSKSKAYFIKSEREKAKVIKERQNRAETLRQKLSTDLREQLFMNKTLGSIGKTAYQVDHYIDAKFEDVLVEVLRGSEFSQYEIEIHNINYALKKSFENLPTKVSFRKKVLR